MAELLSQEEICSILEVRILFMNLASRLAIETATDAAIEGLSFYLEKLKMPQHRKMLQHLSLSSVMS